MNTLRTAVGVIVYLRGNVNTLQTAQGWGQVGCFTVLKVAGCQMSRPLKVAGCQMSRPLKDARCHMSRPLEGEDEKNLSLWKPRRR